MRITLSELKKVREFLISLFPPNKEDWKQSHFILAEDWNYIISQLERFLDEKKFEFDSKKFSGALSYIYLTLSKIKRGEYPYLSSEEKDRLKRAADFLQNLWDTIIERRRQAIEKRRQ